MRQRKLTVPRRNATRHGMCDRGGTGRFGVRRVAIALPLCAGLAACINVSAPEEPIVIELNINIRNEVIYRLADDAANAIEENADIF